MTEQRFRKGDRVDFWNGRKIGANGTPGTIRRVIITRKYVVDWDRPSIGDDAAPYLPEELIPWNGENDEQ